MREPPRATAPTAITLAFTATLAGGCAGAAPSENDAPYTYQAVGTTEQGCVQYTKQATERGLLVDQAIYYRAHDGDYTTDRRECAPETQGKEADTND